MRFVRLLPLVLVIALALPTVLVAEAEAAVLDRSECMVVAASPTCDLQDIFHDDVPQIIICYQKPPTIPIERLAGSEVAMLISVRNEGIDAFIPSEKSNDGELAFLITFRHVGIHDTFRSGTLDSGVHIASAA